jgi:hypothetical protein
LTIEVKQDPLEVGFVEDFLVFGGAQEQGGSTEIVDVAGNAFGVIKESGDKGVAEELALKTGDPEMMLDIGGGFFEIEGPEVITDGQALVEGAVGSKAQLVGQVGLTEQDQGQLGGGVEVVIEQKAELVKEVRWELVGFVDSRVW